jgi:hypothetical protein
MLGDATNRLTLIFTAKILFTALPYLNFKWLYFRFDTDIFFRWSAYKLRPCNKKVFLLYDSSFEYLITFFYIRNWIFFIGLIHSWDEKFRVLFKYRLSIFTFCILNRVNVTDVTDIKYLNGNSVNYLLLSQKIDRHSKDDNILKAVVRKVNIITSI